MKLIAPAILAATVATTAHADVTIWDTDFKGRPPFERNKQTMPVTEAARFETAKATEVRTVDFSGRPPFQRSVEKLVVVDSARFEVDEDRVDFSGRPPYKRH